MTGGRPPLSRRRALAMLGLGGLACSQDEGPFPSREIKLIVQAAPGGASDTVSRIMGSLIEPELGVPVVCENKPGASGALAFSYVVRRPPDGYTLGHAPVEIAMVRSLGYADVGPEEMTLLSLVAKIPPALVVRQDAPWQDFSAFVEAARREPGAVIVANSGTGSIWHFNALLLERRTGIRVTHVPYSGSSNALVSLLGGHLDAAVAGVSEVVPQIEAGQVRALAVLDEARAAVLPNTPSVGELGPAFGAPAWSGFFGPAGVPVAIQEKLQQAFAAAFDHERWRSLCEERGMTPELLSGAAFERFALAQAEFFAREIPELLRMER